MVVAGDSYEPDVVLLAKLGESLERGFLAHNPSSREICTVKLEHAERDTWGIAVDLVDWRRRTCTPRDSSVRSYGDCRVRLDEPGGREEVFCFTARAAGAYSVGTLFFLRGDKTVCNVPLKQKVCDCKLQDINSVLYSRYGGSQDAVLYGMDQA
nr:hypothetical protein Iba_chr01fCG3150 [Ipomoea batatas]